MSKYKHLINATKKQYDDLIATGMFFELHPELTGNYDEDMKIIKGYNT